MTVRHTILVGTDGSDGSRAAIRWAAREAERRLADLSVLHAYERVWGTADTPDHALVEVARSHAEEIAADARLAAHAAAPGITIRSDAVIGDPRAALLDAAASAALVVVGNRGRGGFTSLLLGSVSQHVATHAPCPATVVRGFSAGPDGRVVVGVDGSPSGDQALRLAFEEAAARRCPLIAIRAYEPPLPLWTPGMPVDYHPDHRHAAERRGLGESLAHWRDKFPDVSVEALVVRGDPAGVLVGVSHTAQLLVVGSRGFGSYAGTVLGSVSLKLLHHADCPVLIART